jgi:hypothetical protein
MIYAAIFAYGAAMVAANLLVTVFGPVVTPINAFFLIGFDLAVRDWLHIRVRPWQMLLLIISTGAITFALNPAAGNIAIASAVAFTAAAVIDWGVFSALSGSWLKRANISNIVGAAVDSAVFPTLAFGVLIPHIIASQFAAKVVGGAIWSWILRRA